MTTIKKLPLRRWEYELVSLLWKTVWKILKKLRLELPCDPIILLLGIYSSDLKSARREDVCTLLFFAALFITARL
jgi:hypothetical protein